MGSRPSSTQHLGWLGRWAVGDVGVKSWCQWIDVDSSIPDMTSKWHEMTKFHQLWPLVLQLWTKASMEKVGPVGPSRSSADWITVVVCKVFPSEPSFKQLGQHFCGAILSDLTWSDHWE
jgi:hypothetical protein